MHALLVAVSLVAPSRDPWPIRFVPVQATLMIDWSQTLWNTKHGWVEANPLLGKHPSVGRVNTYFLLSTATNALYGFLPRKLRYVARTLLLVQETILIAHNRAIGVQFGTPF